MKRFHHHNNTNRALTHRMRIAGIMTEMHKSANIALSHTHINIHETISPSQKHKLSTDPSHAHCWNYDRNAQKCKYSTATYSYKHTWNDFAITTTQIEHWLVACALLEIWQKCTKVWLGVGEGTVLGRTERWGGLGALLPTWSPVGLTLLAGR